MVQIIDKGRTSGKNRYGNQRKAGAILGMARRLVKGEAVMSGEKKFSKEEAAKILDSLGLADKYDANEFYMGINVELEHGTVDPATNVSSDDPVMTAKIALAHLNELPNYYTLLEEMEEEGEAMLK
jgi:hypothetical protein